MLLCCNSHPGPEGLGFTLTSRDNETNPKDRQVVVKHINSTGVAASDGRLRVGDRIVEINGQCIAELTQQQAVSILKGIQQGASVNLTVTRFVDPLQQEHEETSQIHSRKVASASPNLLNEVGF